MLFTTTIRSPERIKAFLHIFLKYNNKKLTDNLAIKIAGELIKYGLYRPSKVSETVIEKWGSKKINESSKIGKTVLEDSEVKNILNLNPQKHKEAGFSKGWPSRFATWFKLPKKLGFVYYSPNEKIKFSEIGKGLAKSIDIKTKQKEIFYDNVNPEYEQKAFAHAFAKYQRNNPFVRVKNENAPLILLFEVIKKLNANPEFNNEQGESKGISKLELPFLIFWKNNNANELYELIKEIRKKYRYKPSSEVIVDICLNRIMKDKFKKFKPKSIITEYPDEFIRKMRLTGLISLRGGGRFIDINNNEIKKVNYILKKYSKYPKFKTEKEYFYYMAKTDKKLISLAILPISIKKSNKYLQKWIDIYPWDKIKNELLILAKKSLSKDNILKYLSGPIRLEFLISLAIKSKFPHIKVLPNYPCDDEGIPTSTAGGIGNKGDIECYEGINGILIEVTMSEGRTQTIMEIWPIARHLEEFRKKVKNSICYFIAPTIFKDSERQINFIKKEEKIIIFPKTIKGFLNNLDSNSETLYIAQ